MMFVVECLGALPARFAAFLAAQPFDGLLPGAGRAVAARFHFLAQQPPRQKTVQGLRTPMLALDLNPGWHMPQVDAGGGLVDLLPALARAQHEFFDQIAIAHTEARQPDRQIRLLRCADKVIVHNGDMMPRGAPIGKFRDRHAMGVVRPDAAKFAGHGRAVDVSKVQRRRHCRRRHRRRRIVVKGQGHNLWTGWFQSQELVDFVIAHARPTIGGK